MQLAHGRVALWLEQLLPGPGPNLLLLHELGGSSADFVERTWAWPGAVYALDFSGHGRSGRVRGGAYYPELLAADADAALRELGACYVLGVGLGAYVALLLAAARTAQVPATVLVPGAGSAGFGPELDFSTRRPLPPLQPSDVRAELQAQPETDPAALGWLNLDVRPVEYVLPLAAACNRLLLVEDGARRPAWWCATRELLKFANCAGLARGRGREVARLSWLLPLGILPRLTASTPAC